MKWFVVRQEGGGFEYVTLAQLRGLWKDVPILGAERGSRRVIFDRILLRAGRPAFSRTERGRLLIELFAG